ncbi:hypothetical protein TNCV_2655431 [Trichonephila clavipes]|nr:hypothetical protein TNCV_2655431 [Trichonephila clavipes]
MNTLDFRSRTSSNTCPKKITPLLMDGGDRNIMVPWVDLSRSAVVISIRNHPEVRIADDVQHRHSPEMRRDICLPFFMIQCCEHAPETTFTREREPLLIGCHVILDLHHLPVRCAFPQSRYFRLHFNHPLEGIGSILLDLSAIMVRIICC